MKKFYFLLPLILLFCLPAFAKIFRVGYNGTPLAGVDFTGITEANDAAKPGDTIQVSGIIYGSINKRLVIIGYGHYFNIHSGLQSNPGLQNNDTITPSWIHSLALYIGSDSTIIEGCLIGRLGMGISIESKKVIIRRCSGVEGGSIVLNNIGNSINDIRVISSNNLYVSNTSSGAFPCKNIHLYNCLNSAINFVGTENTGLLLNCVNSNALNPQSNVSIKNCILNSYNLNNNVYDNNIFLVQEPVPSISGSNNKWNQLPSNVFVDFNNVIADENNYQLRPNSPAKNFGIDLSGNPTDCGIFGGELAYRYKIGGQSAIPAFYKLSAPTNAATTNPYNITVSIRSNN